MKRKHVVVMGLAALMLVVGLSTAQAGWFSRPVVVELTPEEEDGLLQMREEEKLARDVYLGLYDLWQLKVFQMIASSEQRHMDAVKTLLDKYGLEDPAAGDDVGTFSSPEMQELYEALMALGQISLEAALTVGATIEDLDIYDLRELLAEADNADLLKVYGNLVRGSENHLRAFAGLLEAMGGTYEAQYLTQEEVDEILEATPLRGLLRKLAKRFGFGRN